MSMRFLFVLISATTSSGATPSVQKPTRFNAATIHSLHQLRLDAFIQVFNSRVKSKQDFDEIFLSNMAIRDRRELRTRLESLDVIPKLSRQGDVLIISADDVQLPVEFLNYGTNQVRIGGIPFTYDRSAAPGWQIRQFERKLARAIDGKQAFYRLSIFSRADAAPLDAASKAMAEAMVRKAASTGIGQVAFKKLAAWGTLATIVGGAATGMITSAICFTTDRLTGVDPELVWGSTCTFFNMRSAKLKAADFKGQVGYTTELEKSLEFVRDNGKFDCTEFDPAKADAPQIASGYIAEVELLSLGDGTAAKPRKWRFFKGKVVKGVLKEADVFDADTNNEKLDAHVTYNENPENPVIVKLPQLDNKGVEREPLDVPANYNRELMLLENSTKATRMILLAKTAQMWTKNCLTGLAERKYLRIKGNSPMESDAAK